MTGVEQELSTSEASHYGWPRDRGQVRFRRFGISDFSRARNRLRARSFEPRNGPPMRPEIRPQIGPRIGRTSGPFPGRKAGRIRRGAVRRVAPLRPRPRHSACTSGSTSEFPAHALTTMRRGREREIRRKGPSGRSGRGYGLNRWVTVWSQEMGSRSARTWSHCLRTWVTVLSDGPPGVQESETRASG